MSKKPLTPSEELEKLEQQITLAYLDIDHNFSRAHHVVTKRILPIIDRYAAESKSLWNGSEFWKQFFEASAGVQLSKYVDGEEEGGETYNQTSATQNQTLATEDTQYTHTTGIDETTVSHVDDHSRTISSHGDGDIDDSRVETTMRADYTSASTMMGDRTARSRSRGSRSRSRPGSALTGDEDVSMISDTSLLESLNLEGAQSTPRAAPGGRRQWAAIDSPYSALRSELRAGETGVSDDTPSLRATGRRVPDAAGGYRGLDLGGSPGLPAASTPNTGRRRARSFGSPPILPDSSPFQIPDEKPVLHQVLDKTWRIQATPLKTVNRAGLRPGERSEGRGRLLPTTPRGQLFGGAGDATRTNLYDFEDSDDDSPVRPDLQTKFFDNTPQAQRTPAGRFGGGMPSARKLFTGGNTRTGAGGEDTFMDDDDDDELESMMNSPPVTIQFSLPAKKLLATPAREASRRIVRDILQTAGVKEDDTSLDESAVKASAGFLSYSDDEDIFK